MTIDFKSPATSNNVNTAFMSRDSDTNTTGKVDLQNASSPAVIDAQQVINDNATKSGDNETNLNTHIAENETAHTERDTKANLDTWAITAANGERAYATDEDIYYYAVGGVLIPFGTGSGTGGLSFQGSWNADTNTPSLPTGSEENGFYYVVSVAGSTNLNGITDWGVGDWAIYNGTDYQKIDNSDKVTSVNGQTGVTVVDSQNAYNASTDGAVSLDGTRGAVKIKDNSTPINAPLLQVTNDSESQAYLDVAANRTNILDAEGQFTLRPRDYRFEEDFKENLPDTVYTTSGLGGSVANNNTTPLDGLLSARYTTIGGDLNGEILSPAITNLKPVDYELLGLQLDTAYNGSYGDWELFVQESVNDVTYTDVNSEGLKIGFSAARTSQINFTLPSTAVYYRYKFVCKNESVGAQLDWDNIKVVRNPLNYKITADENNFAIAFNGTNGAVLDDVHNLISSISNLGGGTQRIFWNSGKFTDGPLITGAANGSNVNVSVDATSATQSDVTCYTTSNSAFDPSYIVLHVSNSASDYKYPLENVVQQGSASALDTKSFVPVIDGFGTPTITQAVWSQSGDRVKGYVRGTAGTVQAVEFRMYLPNGYTVHNSFTSTQRAGDFDPFRAGTEEYIMIGTAGDNFLNVSYRSSGNAATGTPFNGNVINNSLNDFFITFDVPVNELSADSIMYSFSPTKHVTGGTEYPVPETIDNVQVYARTFEGTFNNGDVLFTEDVDLYDQNGYWITGSEQRPFNYDSNIYAFKDTGTNEVKLNVNASYTMRITIRYTK